MNVVVVLPAFNEAGNLTPLVAALLRAGDAARIEVQIVVVDDGSTDGTASELDALLKSTDRVHVVTHAVNRGFAPALRSGIAAACARGCDAAVFMDSDLSHNPDDMPRLIKALQDGGDVAIGSRFVAGGGMVGVPPWRVAISRAGNLVGRTMLGIRVRDLTTGYRAMRRRVLEGITLDEDGFTIQLEAVVKAYAAGFRIVEVPITLATRRFGASHMYYSLALFAQYYRLLTKCRGWVRDGRV